MCKKHQILRDFPLCHFCEEMKLPCGVQKIAPSAFLLDWLRTNCKCSDPASDFGTGSERKPRVDPIFSFEQIYSALN